ncbi:hypothetical protein [Paraflavitalea speifideaquila]|uniref:hypothetical protein n=1 Tax=Paraflavitalea speifideaquila TaxID=3076558 RepID=UPI0028E3ACEE|nr:hypothetical protein [Paraflavitalea speifideiaquila]
MKQLYALLSFLLIITTLHAQVKLSADGPGDTYELIESKGFGIENPECIHGSFGRHVTEIFDNTLGKNVFVFHSHATADNDRCTNLDRVRMEIKGGNGSTPKCNIRKDKRLITDGSSSWMQALFLPAGLLIFSRSRPLMAMLVHR